MAFRMIFEESGELWHTSCAYRYIEGVNDSPLGNLPGSRGTCTRRTTMTRRTQLVAVANITGGRTGYWAVYEAKTRRILASVWASTPADAVSVVRAQLLAR